MRKLHLDWHGYFPLDERTIRDKVEDRSGVFKICVPKNGGGLKPVYVGMASSARTGLLNKALAGSGDCVRSKAAAGGLSFKFVYLYEKKDLEAALKALYRHYTPVCNEPEFIPDAEEVEVNYN